MTDPSLHREGEALPIAPSLSERPFPGAKRANLVSPRLLIVSALAILLALVAGVVAIVLTHLIGFFTNLSYYGRISTTPISPAGHHIGLFAIFVPVIGGLVVGIMARWGSAAIRGHGIPEAMEQVLLNESRISPRVAFWKPISAAVAIGTGGPFGAEGPIIATGAALGSLVGQILPLDASERKALLAAGAAAGMAATFGSPVSAVLLALELLLFEYRARTLIPVALACATAAAFRGAVLGWSPVFAMPALVSPSATSLLGYVAIGAIVGVLATWITRLVYRVEDLFERLPIHWMWWPAIGGVAVGIIGWFEPRTLGVGYDNIEHIVSGNFAVKTLIVLGALKLISWGLALGSGTSGGTLAPLFTIGGAIGALLGVVLMHTGMHIDIRMAALIGMAAMFAAASHATLASIVFAYETTGQSSALVPLLAACATAYLVSCILMRSSIMTEKLVRRGVAADEQAFDSPLTPNV